MHLLQGLLPDGSGFTLKGQQYRVGDFVYLHPHTFHTYGAPAATNSSR